VVAVAQEVELSHTNLTEVSRMVLVHKNAVVVLATGVTASTRMLAVLADTAVTGGDVTALFAVLVKTGRHDEKRSVPEERVARMKERDDNGSVRRGGHLTETGT